MLGNGHVRCGMLNVGLTLVSTLAAAWAGAKVRVA